MFRDVGASAPRRWPLLTLAVLAAVVLVTGWQFANPAVLAALRRDPGALAAGAWWRLLSPLLVHADGWPALVGNAVGLALAGSEAEQHFARWQWLALFLAGDLVGNLAGYAWEPRGAGTSVAVFGLVGGLCAWLLGGRAVAPLAQLYAVAIVAALLGQHASGPIGSALAASVACGLFVMGLRRGGGPTLMLGRAAALAVLLGALALAALRDNHGPPLLAGAVLAGLLLWSTSYIRAGYRRPTTDH